jgi:hypothetical protein
VVPYFILYGFCRKSWVALGQQRCQRTSTSWKTKSLRLNNNKNKSTGKAKPANNLKGEDYTTPLLKSLARPAFSKKPFVANTVVFLKAVISTSISGVTSCVRGSGKNQTAKYKEVMRLSFTAQFIPFVMEANGRLGEEAQKLVRLLNRAQWSAWRTNFKKVLTHSGLQLERRSTFFFLLDSSIVSCSSEGLRHDIRYIL